jgi:hypothetical protein
MKIDRGRKSRFRIADSCINAPKEMSARSIWEDRRAALFERQAEKALDDRAAEPRSNA